MIIGIVGSIGSGKGTVGDILVNNFGFKSESYAAPLKDAASIIFGWDRALLEGDTKESREFREKVCPFWSQYIPDFTPRKALQLFGTESVRDVFHEDIWILSLKKRLLSNEDYVITDVRFPNEIEFIEESDGVIWEVVGRHGKALWYETALLDNIQRNIQHGNMKYCYPEVHYSEWAWIGQNKPGYEILNNGKLFDLEQKVRDMLVITYER